MSDVIYRDAVRDDLHFVLSAWLRSFAKYREKGISADDYYAGHHDVVLRLLQNAKTVIASPEGAPHVIVGFCCFSPQIVHYAYVKNVYRAKYFPDERVAINLLKICVDTSLPIVVTHRTDAWNKFAINNSLSVVYNPYPIYLVGFVDTESNRRRDV